MKRAKLRPLSALWLWSDVIEFVAQLPSARSSLILASKPAELEALDDAHRRLMGVAPAFNKLVRRAEYFYERHGIVMGDRQPAAPFGAVGSERPDDDEAPGHSVKSLVKKSVDQPRCATRSIGVPDSELDLLTYVNRVNQLGGY